MCNTLEFLVRPARFELATYGFVVSFLIKKQVNNGNKK